MGLSRNKVAVPAGAAGTPPFWSALSGRGIVRRTEGDPFLFATVYVFGIDGYEGAPKCGGPPGGSSPRISPSPAERESDL